MDLRDIRIVVQYTPSCDLCTLMQRFGRAARGDGVDAVAVLLVERKHTTAGREEAAAKAAERIRKKMNKLKAVEPRGKRTKRKPKGTVPNTPAPKRMALATIDTPNTPVPTAGPSRLRQQCNSPAPSASNTDDEDECSWSEDVREAASDVSEVESEVESQLLDEVGVDEPVAVAPGVGAARRPKKRRKGDLEVGSPMDLFINPPPQCKCRREPTNSYFKNRSGGGK